MKYTNKQSHILSIFISILILSFSITASGTVYGQESVTNNVQDDRPNILLIVGDDFGFSDVGSFGSEISTPNLDTLASEGKMFTNYHTHPVCSPARASLLTGVDNHLAGIGTMFENIASNQIGQPGYETYINDKVVTVAELLRDGGYHTLLSGKWHLSGHDNQNGSAPYDRGFEETFTLLESGAQHFAPISYYAGGSVTFLQNGQPVERPDNVTYSSDLYTNILIDQVEKYKDNGQPLFMYLSFQVAHSPFQAPSEYLKKYDGVYDVGYDKIRQDRFEKQKELGIWSSDMQLPERIPANPSWDSLTGEDKQYKSAVLRAHAAMIDNTDYNIGKFLQYLKDIEKYDNTLIIFLSDNGSSEPLAMKNANVGTTIQEANEFNQQYNNSAANIGNSNSLVNYDIWGTSPSVSPLSFFKTSQGEGGARAPFIVKEPLVSNNGTQTEIVNAFIHVSDITPTILEYANVEQPSSSYNGKEVHQISGKSMKTLLEG